MRTITVFLIAVVLIAGTMSYGGRESRTLIVGSTAGGSVVAPGEGTFAYLEGELVNLVAGIELGNRFVNWTGDVDTIANANDAVTSIIMNNRCSIAANFEEINFMVAAGYGHTVGLRSDGGMIAVGDTDRYYGQCDVDGWTDITQVAAGYAHTAGLKEDGTVVAVGYTYHGECNVDDWTDVVQVAAGRYHTVGLRRDGTVVAVGFNNYGQCDRPLDRHNSGCGGQVSHSRTQERWHRGRGGARRQRPVRCCQLDDHHPSRHRRLPHCGASIRQHPGLCGIQRHRAVQCRHVDKHHPGRSRRQAHSRA